MALASHIQTRGDDVRVWIFGAQGGAEQDIAARNDIAFQAVKVRRLPSRKMSPAMLGVPAALAGAVSGARSSLKEVGACVVLGFGGYVSFPTVAAARLSGIPVFLHEQNTAMGKSNRAMARFVRGVFTSFEDTAHAPAAKAIFSGNPCRFDGLDRPDRSDARKQLGLAPDRAVLFVFGGSQGAVSINKAMLSLAASNRLNDDFQIFHIAGPKNYEALKTEYEKALGSDAALKVEVVPYCREMDRAYAAADLALCRAGATTIVELMCLGVPSVLVPYPFAAEGHQDKNARHICDRGAAVMIMDDELKSEMFEAVVLSLLRDRDRLDNMGAECGALFRPGAAQRMADVLLEHCRGTRHHARTVA